MHASWSRGERQGEKEAVPEHHVCRGMGWTIFERSSAIYRTRCASLNLYGCLWLPSSGVTAESEPVSPYVLERSPRETVSRSSLDDLLEERSR